VEFKFWDICRCQYIFSFERMCKLSQTPRNYDYDAEVWEQESRRAKEEKLKAGKK
jgi:hypothetical protein